MITTSSVSGRFALMVAHCAGMLDLVALPIWVGALIQYYGFDPQQAGGLATVFLFGAVISSIFLATRLQQVNTRLIASLGFAVGAICFAVLTQTQNYALMALLHGLAGLSVGSSLSVTHRTIATSPQPHRMFAIVGTALGVFSIIFLGATQVAVAKGGGSILFVVFSAVMLTATVASALAFPVLDKKPNYNPQQIHLPAAAASYKIPPSVWFGVVGICAMGLVQAMTFSFLERVGVENNFGLEAITGVLIALGVVNLFPAPLAAIFEKRISARWVLLLGPTLQAILCFVIMTSGVFKPYAAAASVFAAVLVFTHTFAFGVLAKLDHSGRVLTATPAMLMIGAGIGPILGGSLVKNFGYESIGFAALIISLIATFCFTKIFSKTETFQAQEGQV